MVVVAVRIIRVLKLAFPDNGMRCRVYGGPKFTVSPRHWLPLFESAPATLCSLHVPLPSRGPPAGVAEFSLLQGTSRVTSLLAPLPLPDGLPALPLSTHPTLLHLLGLSPLERLTPGHTQVTLKSSVLPSAQSYLPMRQKGSKQ